MFPAARQVSSEGEQEINGCGAVMTFAVIDTGSGSDKVVGTIWANAETEAQAIASDLLKIPERQTVVIRRAEERELPLKPFD
jgi:hypothetical protein